MRLRLEKGARVDVFSFTSACGGGHEEIVRTMLERGLDRVITRGDLFLLKEDSGRGTVYQVKEKAGIAYDEAIKLQYCAKS